MGSCPYFQLHVHQKASTHMQTHVGACMPTNIHIPMQCSTVDFGFRGFLSVAAARGFAEVASTLWVGSTGGLEAGGDLRPQLGHQLRDLCNVCGAASGVAERMGGPSSKERVARSTAFCGG